MKTIWQNFCGKIKEENLFIGMSLAGLLLTAGFWGIMFPQYLFTGDCVKIFDADGRDVEAYEEGEENLYLEISTAKPEQIEVKISILEWAKR